jgi:plasmid stabilization system protein ParE
LKVKLSGKAEQDLARLEEFIAYQTRSKRVLARFKREFESAKNSISKNPSGYPLVENSNIIRQKYQWRYWYFFIDYSDEVVIQRIFHESENWLNNLE